MSLKVPFYPRQVWKRHWRRIHRWMKRATIHEVITPEGYEWKNGEEVSIKYEDGKFRVIP